MVSLPEKKLGYSGADVQSILPKARGACEARMRPVVWCAFMGPSYTIQTRSASKTSADRGHGPTTAVLARDGARDGARMEKAGRGIETG